MTTQPYPAQTSPTAPKQQAQPVSRRKGMAKGLLLTFTLAVAAGQLAELPYFSVLGIMLIALMLGMVWGGLMEIPAGAAVGIAFSSKFLLRAGIILMGLRLHIRQIAAAGLPVLVLDAAVIAFTLALMLPLGRRFGLDRRLAALLAAGTAVCGAAAIVAVAPFIGARKEQTALSVACIAMLGTAGTVTYLLLAPRLGLDPYGYGVWAGATLQELGHVIAASADDGEAGSIAIVVKLGRVAMLVPVVLVFGFLFRSKENDASADTDGASGKRLPFPWFIIGFLAMCLMNSLDIVPSFVTGRLIDLSVLLLSAAMAGIGLGIRLTDFRQAGAKAVAVGLIGFAALAVFGQLLLRIVPGLIGP